MKSKIEVLLVGAIIGVYNLLYAPDEVLKNKEGGQIQWIEGTRGWSENGTNLWTGVSPLPSYNVGIGTNTPQYKLDVLGHGRFQGDLYINSWPISVTSAPTTGYVLKWTGSAFTPQPDLVGGGVGGSGQPTQVAFWTSTSEIGGSNNLWWDNTNARLGIGTSTPSYKLDVVGSSRIQGDLYINSWPISVTSAPTVGYVLKWNGTAFVPQPEAAGLPPGSAGQTLRHDGTSWVANSLLFNNGTNIGIGTTSPSYKLDVAGTSRIQGDLYINSWPISVTSAPTVGYVLKWTGSAFTPQPDLVGGGVGGSGQPTQVAFWTSTSEIGGSNNLWWDNTNARLGIGTNTPSYKLDVAGSSRIQGDLYINSWPISVTSAPTVGYVLKWNGTAFVPQPEAAGLPPGSAGQTLRHDGTSWVANSLLFNNGTNIGIGTTSPSYKLDVAGSSRIQGDLYINSWPISVTSAPTVGYVLKWNGTAFVPQPEAAGLPPGSAGQTLRHDGTSWVANSLLFNNGTNIGIGTTSPSYKLDVAGSSRIQGDLYINSWPISVTSAPTVGYVLKWNGTAFVPQADATGIGGSGTATQVAFWTSATTIGGSNNLWWDNTNARLGIGTSTPSYKLDVVGTSRIQGDLYINSWPISVTSAPTVGYVLKWNGTAFVPQPDVGGACEWLDAGEYLYPADDASQYTRVYESATPSSGYRLQAAYSSSIYGLIGTQNSGVQGNSNNTSGAGVFGDGGTVTTGVYGQTNTSSTEFGVFGFNSNASGSGILGLGSNVTTFGWSAGGDGVIGASDAYGVIGSNYNGSNTNRWGALGTQYHGVYGSTDNSSGAGVMGVNTLASSDVPGVYGQSNVTDFWGYGGYFVGGYMGVRGVVSPTGSSTYYGAYGSVSGGSGYNFGVYGYATGGSQAYGVLGYSDKWGVYGYTSDGTKFGVSGFNTNSTSGTGVAGLGNNGGTFYYLTVGSGGAFTGTNYGAVGFATNTSGQRAGGYFATTDGSAYAYVGLNNNGTIYKINGTGSVSTIMETREGKKNLFAPESPEAWIQDYGEGQLKNGRAIIYLDKLFLDCVVIDEKNPLKVFVQLRDDCNGVYVKTYEDHFEVIELQNGKSNARFCYQVIAKWKGYEKLRFPDAPTPPAIAATKVPSVGPDAKALKKIEPAILTIQQAKTGIKKTAVGTEKGF
jgi:hypothetical protein